MHKLRKNMIVIGLILFIFSLSGIIEAVDFIASDEIEAGMRGYGKTVFKGTEVEKFPVEIVDVLRNQNLGEELILIKAGGSKINSIGGIAAGMSGTPIYIDNKLAGAIGYGWQFSNNNYALVTPIEYMMKLLTDEAETEDIQNIKINYQEYNTPLMVSGLRGRALDNIKEKFASLDLDVLPGSGLRDVESVEKLKPGSAISVQMVRGDVNIASMGTLTHIEGDKIIAFGHPFTNKGEVNFLLSEAYINGIIPSDQQPFKLGSPGKKPVGIINTDRGAGIAGKLNEFPEIIPLEINVTDKSRNKTETIKVQIIKDERYITSLGSNIALQAIDNVIDRIGQGTARSYLKVMGNGLPDYLVQRQNMYYSRHDIASVALYDFYRLLDLICTNPFKKINLIDLELKIEISREDRVALVEEARVLNEEIYPGDELDIEITLHPYRAETFIEKISLKLPDDIKPGRTSMIIEGGYAGITSVPDFQDGDEASDVNQGQIQGYKNFESILTDFLEQPQNNDLIVQVYQGYPVTQMPSKEEAETPPELAEDEPQPPGQPEPPAEDLPETSEAEEEKEEEEIKTIKETDYVLEGSLTLDVEIKETESTADDSSEQTQPADETNEKTPREESDGEIKDKKDEIKPETDEES